MAKENTKLVQDLEHLNRRIQEIKRRLGDTENRTKSLERSLEETVRSGYDGKHRHKAGRA